MMYYKSETYNYSSKPKHGAVHGTHNIVEIKHGKGMKTKEALDASGKVIERRRSTLKKSEIKEVLGGRFVPGFWKNCAFKTCDNAAARKTRRGRNAA